VKKLLSIGLLPLLLLTACGGGSSSSDSSSKSDVNVAAYSNGATALATYNEATAGNLIDEDDTTTWISDPESPIIVTFGRVEKLKSFELRRVSAPALLGTNPDILIELSQDNLTYEKSNASVMTGGVVCYSAGSNTTSMSCKFDGTYSAKYVRITSLNGKSFEFTEFEAVAYK